MSKNKVLLSFLSFYPCFLLLKGKSCIHVRCSAHLGTDACNEYISQTDVCLEFQNMLVCFAIVQEFMTYNHQKSICIKKNDNMHQLSKHLYFC